MAESPFAPLRRAQARKKAAFMKSPAYLNSTQGIMNTALQKGPGQAEAAQAHSAEAENRFLGFAGQGQSALNDYATSAIAAAMPGFQNAFQGIQENTNRRGVGGGDTAGGYEGRSINDFRQNISNAVAGQATDLYGKQLGAYGDVYGTNVGQAESAQNRFLGLGEAQLERDAAGKASKRASKAATFGAVGDVLGTVGGFGIDRWLNRGKH